MRSTGKAVDALRAADAAWLKAYNARDVERSTAFFDKQGTVLLANGPMVTGKKALAKFVASGFAMRDYKIGWRASKAGVAESGELGFTSGAYRMSFKDAAGKTVSDKGKYLMVWKKQADGVWKALFDISNSDLPRFVAGV